MTLRWLEELYDANKEMWIPNNLRGFSFPVSTRSLAPSSGFLSNWELKERINGGLDSSTVPSRL